MKKRPQKNHKAAPPVSGIVNCQKGHAWSVVDLNPERQTVNCPVCGDFTSIRQGLQHDRQK